MDIGIRCLRHHSHEFRVLNECVSDNEDVTMDIGIRNLRFCYIVFLINPMPFAIIFASCMPFRR